MSMEDDIDMRWAHNATKRKVVDRVQKRVRQYTYERVYQRILPELSASGERLWQGTFRRVNNYLRGTWWRL